MTKSRSKLLLIALAVCTALLMWRGLRRSPQEPQTPSKTNQDTLVGIPLAEGITVGAATRFGNLTVFPIFAAVPADIGDFTTLPDALKQGRAEVREKGGGAEVNQLVIENKGKASILVLAGTVVTGGNQDRQIAQDFVIKPGDVADVEAYCVERNRWEGTRQGVATGGKFRTLPTLADKKVRVAGQFEKSQGKVWNEVDKVNAANAKDPATGTLAATLDDAELAQEREALATKVRLVLAQTTPASKVVGMAYGVNGHVHTARWFLNNQLFLLHRDTLINTAAAEAITAGQANTERGPALTPESVVSFVDKIRQQRDAVEREGDGRGVRERYQAAEGYAWSLSTASAAPPPAAAAAKRPTRTPESEGSMRNPRSSAPLTTGFSSKR